MKKDAQEGMNTPSTNHEEKLITLAIHTFEKAQILKTMLETEGIEVYLQNVNQLLPVVSAGVRVRIKESDLPKALGLIEDSNWNRQELKEELNTLDHYVEGKPIGAVPYVLVPVDFSDFTPNVVAVAFHFAARRNLEVILLHACYVQLVTSPLMFFGEVQAIPSKGELSSHKELERSIKKMEQLEKAIKESIEKGELPKVTFQTLVRSGVAEDIILSIARQAPPIAIVMGTRGKSRRSEDLIGSVAAEVIDRAKVPVFIVPEETPVTDLAKIKNVGVATSFDQRDFVLFDRMMHLMKPNTPTYRLFNISRSAKEWSDLELRAMSEYHKVHYPNSTIEFSKLDDGDFSEALNSFIAEKEIGLVVVNTYRRNLFARFFNPGMARRMLFHAGTPLLVMHSSSWR
ncbi:universal stress protein [Porphyromonas circumdentaria]|uniref:Nucleotide-binding universal stress protein, UspA family n=1 Tax=Porphyromonas circumdentaria TaxID=29524 RepID=A0A1T4M2F3_9PORP|nr:universal stress protein [Porphyromonas circumdentaria]MBB6275602.1 nucleotide-binding universal stress UspA family protein [Porphyromonas circumdentaria]SJZ61112.1 Nucleotide-binding universal stress protein, UspA family [Porphyromonas circumdentaria]